MDNNQKFKSSDFYISAFLIAKGVELVGVEKVEGTSRSAFVFKESPDREQLMRAYNFAKENSEEVMIDFRKVVRVVKDLKTKLYQDRL